MDKVSQSSKNVTPYGGLNLAYQAMNGIGLAQFLNDQMGLRNKRSEYSYSDVVYSLFGNVLVQGSYIADLELLKEKFSQQYFKHIPSPDTVEYVCQELKVANIINETDKGVIHQLNYNDKMNDTLVGLAIKTKQLKAGEGYTLDHDNVIIENDKQDAVYTYKKNKGYHPCMSFIGRIPVHLENHNGNTPASYQQKETLKRCFEDLQKHAVKIKNFRGDSASYQKGVIEEVEQHTEHFYIRMDNCEDLRERCGKIEKWETVEINNEKKEVASMLYKPFKGNKEYRVVITRKKRKDGQMDMLSGSAYTFYGIMTNNNTESEKQAIEFYNQRGDDENSNRYMLNDFNLHHLPFPDLSTNTVFMYLMAMCATIFEWFKSVLVKNKVQRITLSMRVKAVCFRYITVASTFVKHARQTILTIFSSEPYSILRI